MRLPNRFSLRSFLLAIAAIAVLLALPRQRSLRQHDALRRMGAEISGWSGPRQSLVSRLILGNREGDIADTLSVYGVALSDADDARLSLFPRLHSIRLHDCPDPEGSIKVLATIPYLSWLSVYDSPLTDLSAVTSLHRLRTLDLEWTNVSDNSLEALRGLTELRMLDLEHTLVRGPGLAALSNLPRLHKLDLRHCPIDDCGLEHLKDFAALRDLRLQGTNASREAVQRLQQALPECKIESDYNSTPSSNLQQREKKD